MFLSHIDVSLPLFLPCFPPLCLKKKKKDIICPFLDTWRNHIASPPLDVYGATVVDCEQQRDVPLLVQLVESQGTFPIFRSSPCLLDEMEQDMVLDMEGAIMEGALVPPK